MTRHPVSNTLLLAVALCVIAFVGWRAGAEATEQRLAAKAQKAGLK